MGGFTLLEVLCAIVIAAILAASGFVSYAEMIRKAKRAEGRAALFQLMQQEEVYYARYNTYAGFSAANPNGFKWHSANSPLRSAYEIRALACAEDTLQGCVELTAQPGTANVDGRHKDDKCGTLTLDSNGRQGASGSGSGSDCW